MEKLIKRNRVAVLVAQGYGIGWSTFNAVDGIINLDHIFDPDIAQAVLDKKSASEIEEIAHKKFGEDFFAYGAKNLKVIWVKKGKEFELRDDDGAEWVELKEDIDWITA